jgi:class 3 adenylate cyclase
MPQACASCRSECPDGAKFCLECGTPLPRTCPVCGHPATGGKFCGECGSALPGTSTPPASPPVPDQAVEPSGSAPVSERRTTSVLFGDLVSFTTLSEQRDPEEVRELLSAYFAVARTVVGRYGGTIEKFIGDAVMAVWGVPVAHEDDAERAVRAGLELVSEIALLGEQVAVAGLAMRVGIVTGSVAVTIGAVGEGMVAGDAVNTAARVQSVAEPGMVWVDAETRGLTAAAVAYTDVGEHTLKGKAEPARLFRAGAIVAGRGGSQRVDGLEAPLTGRDAQLRQVKEAFHATESDARTRLLLVEGEAGMGKSRLGWELEKYVDGLSGSVRWHRGRCLSYGDGAAFWAFAEMMRSRLGLLEGDDRATVEDKVRGGVAAYVPNETEAAWLTPRVGALLTGTTGFERTDLFSAWAVYLERVAQSDPLVLLFEDMQYADEGLLDLVDYLVTTCQAALLVVLLARPELGERRSALRAGPRSTVITLGPLSPDDMGAFVDGLVADLPPRARTALVTRAEGVPLYAVETVRSLIDRDAVLARDGRYVFDDPDGSKVDLDQLAAPTSLQTLIAARLDALTPVERRVVQDASVLGQSFRTEGLSALSDISASDLDEAVQGLVSKGLVEVVADPRSPEAGSYRFLQALVQEVAYGTLARKDRRTRHLAAANHLEQDETADALAGVIAQHLLDSLDATGVTDPDRPAVASRARGQLTAAAVRAEALGAPGEALRMCVAALALDPDDDEAARLELRAARTANRYGDAGRALSLGQAAREHLVACGRPREAAEAGAEIGNGLLTLGRHAEVCDLLGPMLDALSDDPDSDRARLALLRPLNGGIRFSGDQPRATELALLELRLAERVGDPAPLAQAMTGVYILLFDAGAPRTGRLLIDAATAINREHQLTDQLGRCLANLLASYATDLPASAALVPEAIEVTRRNGDRTFYELAVANAGFIRWLDGDWDAHLAATADLLDGAVAGKFVGGVQLSAVLICAARGLPCQARDVGPTDDPVEQAARDVAAALTLDADDPAAAAAGAALHRAYGAGDLFDDLEILLPPVVELQLRVGAVERARSLLAIAAPLHGGQASPLLRCQLARLRGLVAAAEGGDAEADLRQAEAAFSAYGAPFYLARTRLELGGWLHRHDRADEAIPLLAQARTALTRLGAAAVLAELDQLDAVAGLVSAP